MIVLDTNVVSEAMKPAPSAEFCKSRPASPMTLLIDMRPASAPEISMAIIVTFTPRSSSCW